MKTTKKARPASKSELRRLIKWSEERIKEFQEFIKELEEKLKQ